jgi:hypothetical protein
LVLILARKPFFGMFEMELDFGLSHNQFQKYPPDYYLKLSLAKFLKKMGCGSSSTVDPDATKIMPINPNVVRVSRVIEG